MSTDPNPMVTGAVPLPTALIIFLEDVLASAGLQSCYVTSVGRTPKEQAVAMLNNCTRLNGVTEQMAIYLPPGQAVIQVVADNWADTATGAGRSRILGLMVQKIGEVGPSNVSHHCLPPDSPLIVADIRRNSVLNPMRFQEAVHGHPQFSKLLDENQVFHLEMLKVSPAAPGVQS